MKNSTMENVKVLKDKRTEKCDVLGATFVFEQLAPEVQIEFLELLRQLVAENEKAENAAS